jgi:hypothetical protein
MKNPPRWSDEQLIEGLDKAKTTFRKERLEERLMHREPEAFHDDQNIRAVVLDIATGKTDATAVWRMHDRLRYLLPAGDGISIEVAAEIVSQRKPQ